MRELKSVILAAGKGTRLRTEGIDLPKVMRLALNKPLIHYVLSALPEKDPKNNILVVGYKKEYVTQAFPEYVFAEQTQQLGTGHAVMSAREALEGFSGDVLVCCGDMPLVKAETYAELYRTHLCENNDCTLLSGTSNEPLPYGRVIRDGTGGFVKIVEDKDCSPEEKLVRELNAGIYIFNCEKLLSALTSLKTDNAQGEYYLTDVPDIMLRRGDKVGVCIRDMGEELIGVNTPAQLKEVEELLKKRA